MCVCICGGGGVTHKTLEDIRKKNIREKDCLAKKNTMYFG